MVHLSVAGEARTHQSSVMRFYPVRTCWSTSISSLGGIFIGEDRWEHCGTD